MNVHVLQHAPFEGLAGIAPSLTQRQAVISTTRFFENASLPPLRGLDLIIAMGGPMSVNDEAELPWLREEKRFIREAVQSGVPVLGVCLGSQLIASALGARVYQNKHKEIGWFPIEAVSADGDRFRFPEKLQVFHWHGETFDLPTGAVQLARSAACENQAFQFGRRTLALQCHLEVTPEAVRAFVDNCGDELRPAPYIQTSAEILAAPAATYAEINAWMSRAIDYLLV
ncbi:MAG: gamma-glutamyl-gamma-aminobutyrate hydrolase family protein [Verrucomicrobia bacterium]|nr:gamma-glutamyl-gamma-aminobutyrate hydrolase family protein [Verrucomicrobiota bacterium]